MPARLHALRDARGTALVTGAAGFVGSHLCERLLGAGWQVIGVDNLSTGSRDHIAHLEGEPGFRFAEHDITEPLPAELCQVDRIFNLACPGSPADHERRPVETVLASTLGTWQLLEVAMARRIRLLHVSAGEVYGEEGSCCDEGKRCAETLCLACVRDHDADIRIARLFDCYGPRLRVDDGRGVGSFIVQALTGQPLTIRGDGRQTRSLCYVDDAVRGLMLLMASDCREPVDLGDPQALSMAELARRVLLLAGSDSPVVFEPLATDGPIPRRPDIATAQRVLDWQPRIGPDEGLRRTIAHFRQRDLPASRRAP
jgi:UDP-glucuronate decarboxylase